MELLGYNGRTVCGRENLLFKKYGLLWSNIKCTLERRAHTHCGTMTTVPLDQYNSSKQLAGGRGYTQDKQ